jgi:ornithine cyclodeaminase
MTKAPAITILDAAQTRAALPFGTLIPALREAFASGARVPPRHHHHIPQPDGTEATLLLMPAWQDAGFLGVKIVSVFPGNSAKGLPGVHSTYLLSDGGTGRPLALIDGNEITGRRTVGVAALGASFLARADASSLLVVGSGRIASLAPEGFAAVRPISRIEVWNRTLEKAEALADRLRMRGFEARSASSLEEAVGRADIVSCATLSTSPLIRAEWLRPGTHLDLIGSFTPHMREADDACMAQGRLFVDSPEAVTESGDLVQPMAAGVIDSEAVLGTLSDLCAGRLPGRADAAEVTNVKAVGTALSDIAAAALAYRTVADTPRGTEEDEP